MGTLFAMRCRCGYESGTLAEGVGMVAITQVPVSCRACGELRSIHHRERDARGEPITAVQIDDERNVSDGCPVCGGPVVSVTPRGGPCPRCGEALEADTSVMGVWD